MRTLIVSCLLFIPAIVQASDPLIAALQVPTKVWSQDSLASELYKSSRGRNGEPSRNEIEAWAKLLRVDRPIKADASLSAGVQVREIALTCIEELTGESFYPVKGTEAPMRVILSTTVNGEIQRFHIVEIVPKDLPAIQRAVHAWLKKKPSK